MEVAKYWRTNTQRLQFFGYMDDKGEINMSNRQYAGRVAKPSEELQQPTIPADTQQVEGQLLLAVGTVGMSEVY